MQQAAAAALEAANWAELTPRLQYHAQAEIIGCRWRGMTMAGSTMTAPTINNQTADDLIEEAIIKLWKGTRTYRADLTLEVNIKRVISSLVSNHYKKTKASPFVSHIGREDPEKDSDELDPIENAADPAALPNAAEVAERRQLQQEFLASLYRSVADDPNLGLLLMAFEDRKYLPAEIEEATGIPASRVSELKRKLETRARKLVRQNPHLGAVKPLQEAT